MLCSIPICVNSMFIYVAPSNIYLFGPHMMLHNLDNSIQRLCEIAWDELMALLSLFMTPNEPSKIINLFICHVY